MYKEILLNMVVATERAAISCSEFLGKGDRKAANHAAAGGMHSILKDLDLDGVVVVGERPEHTNYLNLGERLGKTDSNSPKVDIATVSVDGSDLVANGEGRAISALAIAPRGDLFKAPNIYMEKLAAGPRAKGIVHLNNPVEVNIRGLAQALNKEIHELNIAVLGRTRHTELIRKIREAGAGVRLLHAGDIAAGIATCFPESGIDMLLGIGGAPEAVLAAAGAKTLGGVFMGRLAPDSDEQMEKCMELGIQDIDRIWELEDLVRGNDCMFAATGITNSAFLSGIVRLSNKLLKTRSIVISTKTGSIRYVDGLHRIGSDQYSDQNGFGVGLWL